MASVSVYRSYAKCVLGTKTLILPTQDNGWLSVPPTELCNYQQQQQQQNFINKQINLQKYCPARIFEVGQCLQNMKIKTKAINIIILSRGLIHLGGYGKLKARYLPVKDSSEHFCLLKGLCQNSPFPTPLYFDPQAWSTHPLLGQSLGYPAKPTKTARPLIFGHFFGHWIGLVPGCAGHQAKT